MQHNLSLLENYYKNACIDFFQLVAGDCFGTLVKVKREQGSKYVKH